MKTKEAATLKETVKPPEKPIKPIEPDYAAIRATIREKEPKLNARFDTIKTKIQEEVNELNYKIWIEPLVAVKFEKPVLTLYHQPFSAAWVMEHYKTLIESFTDCEINVISEAKNV